MILEGILSLLFSVIAGIIDLIPVKPYADAMGGFAADLTAFIEFLSYGFYIFPVELFLIFIGNVLFWLGLQMVWAIAEWIYKKFPGVN